MEEEVNNPQKDINDTSSQPERRNGERRISQRRNDDSDDEYEGDDRRQLNDRRITIINRLNTNVTDRRSMN